MNWIPDQVWDDGIRAVLNEYFVIYAKNTTKLCEKSLTFALITNMLVINFQ